MPVHLPDEMYRPPLSRIKIESKLGIIRESLSELEALSQLNGKEFIADKKNYAIAEHYLRRALEATFDIAGHIISRFPFSPGKRPSTLKDLAIALADKKIVDEKFGKETLVRMAGYRNRLVHFYDEVTEQELYEIIKTRLGDIEHFAKCGHEVMTKPKQFGLTIED